MKLIIEPRGDRLHILLDKMVERVSEHIFRPQEHREPTRIGTVLETGDKVTKFKTGQKILASFYTGVPIDLPQYGMDGTLHKIATESEILALVSEEDDEKEEYLPYGGI